MSILENPLLQAEERAPQEHSWPFMEKRRTLRVQTVPTGPSMTKTDMAPQCDINLILKNYTLTGTARQRTDGRYGDFPDAIDFQTAQNLVIESQRQFDSLPAKLRDRFNNEPSALMAFLADPQNRKEAEQLGLIERQVPDQQPQPAQPAPPPPPAE